MEQRQEDYRTLSLAGLRRALVAERALLREAQIQEALARALAEQRAIEAAGDDRSLGSNAEARARALTLALEQDREYLLARGRTLRHRQTVETLEAELEVRLDERRERELAVRGRLADALLAASGRTLADAADRVAEETVG